MTRPVRLLAVAGSSIGRGHANRMLALGAALGSRGADVELQLLAGTLTDGERERAAGHGIRVVDAGANRAAASVVIDVPEPGPVARELAGATLVVFDDRDAFEGRAAIVVQPSQPSWRGSGEAGAVLAGYRFVPIDPAIVRVRVAHGEAPRARTAGRSVVVCFGGSDPADVTHRIAPALAAVAEVTAVLGASYRGLGAGDGVTALRDPDDLVERLADADVAVVGAGTMKFEAACLGTPAILLGVADDQLATGPPFAATGAAVFLGDGRTIDPVRVADEVGRLLADPAALGAMRRAGAELIDGLGGDRIAAAILGLDDARVRSRPVNGPTRPRPT